jgi:hypothetical protein
MATGPVSVQTAGRAGGGPSRLNFKLFGEDADTPGEPKLLFESGFQ